MNNEKIEKYLDRFFTRYNVLMDRTHKQTTLVHGLNKALEYINKHPRLKEKYLKKFKKIHTILHGV